MKAKFNHWYNCLAALLLSILGFSSCGSTHKAVTEKNMYKPIEGGIMLLYGTPTRDYRVIEKNEKVEKSSQDSPATDEKTEQHKVEESTKDD